MNNLPVEIHATLAEYLSASDLVALSHTCSKLQTIYAPLSHFSCSVVTSTPDHGSSSNSRLIPIKAILQPHRYSWFLSSKINRLYLPSTSLPPLSHSSSPQSLLPYYPLLTKAVLPPPSPTSDPTPSNHTHIAPQNLSHLLASLSQLSLTTSCPLQTRALYNTTVLHFNLPRKQTLPHLPLAHLRNLTTFSLSFSQQDLPHCAPLPPSPYSLSDWYSHLITDLNSLPCLDNVALAYLVTNDFAYSTAQLLKPHAPKEDFSRLAITLISDPLESSSTPQQDNQNTQPTNHQQPIIVPPFVLPLATELTLHVNYSPTHIPSSLIYHLERISLPNVSTLALHGVDSSCVQLLYPQALSSPPLDQPALSFPHAVINPHAISSLAVTICDFEHLPDYLALLAQMSNLKHLVLNTKIMRFPLAYHDILPSTTPATSNPTLTLEQKESAMTAQLADLLQYCKHPQNTALFGNPLTDDSLRVSLINNLLDQFPQKYPALPSYLYVRSLCDPLGLIQTFLKPQDDQPQDLPPQQPPAFVFPNARKDAHSHEFFLFALSVCLDLAYVECICECILRNLHSLQSLALVNLPYLLDSPRFALLVNTHPTLCSAAFTFPNAPQNITATSYHRMQNTSTSANQEYPHRFHLHARLKFYQNYYTYYRTKFRQNAKAATTLSPASSTTPPTASTVASEDNFPALHQLPFVNYLKLSKESSSKSSRPKNKLEVNVTAFREKLTYAF